jgi:hypothetical protein
MLYNVAAGSFIAVFAFWRLRRFLMALRLLLGVAPYQIGILDDV